MEITTIGLDLAKQVFQVHAVDASGAVVLRKRLRRSQVLAFFANLSPCLVGMEACATAHYWGRELMALGHDVRLMPPRYVKAYVKRQKNDAADAAAICEAVTRPSMSFVPVKSADQQAALMLHRTRDLLVRQRTMLINSLRGHLAEFGIVEPQGPGKVARLVSIIRAGDDRVPELARQVLEAIAGQLEDLATRVEAIERRILAWHKSNPASRRLATIPGIGPVIATAISASVPDPGVFSSGRQFAAWLGLVPRQNSTGGKDRLGRISKQGNGYLRRLLVNGAQAVLRCSKAAKQDPWLTGSRSRRLCPGRGGPVRLRAARAGGGLTNKLAHPIGHLPSPSPADCNRARFSMVTPLRKSGKRTLPSSRAGAPIGRDPLGAGLSR